MRYTKAIALAFIASILATHASAGQEDATVLDDILKKAIFAGFVGVVAAAISWRGRIRQGIGQHFGRAVEAFRTTGRFIVEDSLRVLSVSIILSALIIAWTFRYENVGKDLYMNRITGTIFFAYPE